MASSATTATATTPAVAPSKASTVEVLPTKDAIGARAAKLIASHAAAAIEARGRFTIAVSGGSLPDIVLKGLTPDVVPTLHLDKWEVFFADERCVTLEDKDSNYRVWHDSFFTRYASLLTPSHIHAIDTTLVSQPAAAAEAYANNITRVFASIDAKSSTSATSSIPQFDLLLLGMGPDGHTCSLFPGHALLDETKLLVASITDSPKPPPSRITLTYPILNAARAALFVSTGGEKADVLARVIANDRTYPSARIASSSVTWLVDDAAAARLAAPKS